MLAAIKIVGKVEAKKFDKVCEKIRKMKSRPDGVYELVCELEYRNVAKSYCNDRLFWLAYQLERNGIKCEWYKC